MPDELKFRTVLRGDDHEQVTAAIRDLQKSLGVARRAAADRTIELARVIEAKTSLEAELAELRSREVPDHDWSPVGPPTSTESGHPSRGFAQLGTRLTSILSLAETEAEQLRSTAADEARAVRAEAAAAAEAQRSDSDQYAAQVHERADREVAKMTSAATATADGIVAQANEQAQARRAEGDRLLEAQRAQLAEERSQHETYVADARAGAARVVADATEQAEQIRRQTHDELADVVRRRDAVHAHLTEVNQLLVVLETALADEERRPDLEPTSRG